MDAISRERIKAILDGARDEGREVLLETEGLALLEAIGLETPAHVFVRGRCDCMTANPSSLPGDRVVVKVISTDVLHKSDLGGVAIVSNRTDNIAQAIGEMEARFRGKRISGFTINQFVEYDASLGNELLVGMRWTEDFGPVVTFGPGGIHAEFLSRNLRPEASLAVFSPRMAPEIENRLDRLAVTQVLYGGLRGQKPRIEREKVLAVVRCFLDVAAELMPERIAEFEVNPFVVTGGRLVALDVLLKMPRREPRPIPEPRPIEKLGNLLQPQSVAVIGVSDRLNPGHIILNNLLYHGFPRDRIFVVKPGTGTIEGCRCYPDIASLPERMDLFVLAISAAQVPETLTELIDREKAQGIIVIPGGLEEKEGGAALIRRVGEDLSRSRHTQWQGPVINGGNCLGIRSVPGRYDTMFIPQYKLGEQSEGDVSPLAFISQSGAFAISKTNKLAGIRPKYVISIGNQMDLTIGDYLQFLERDREIELFAVYVEGFKPLDGLRFLESAREIARSGRTVVLYRAGRTAEGAKASASHTASIAGDYAVTRGLAGSTGAVVAEGVDDFEDLVRLFVFLRRNSVRGFRLGAVSNAGFECVSVADNLGSLQTVPFGDSTVRRLREIFQRARIEQLVDIHNPVDLTPIANDEAYEDVFRTVMDDDGIDVGLLGIVPMTPALNTLRSGPGHREDMERQDSIVSRAIRLKADVEKAWVAVVDGGPPYDAMARRLEENGIPTFRTADRALRLFNVFCAECLRAARALN